MPAGSRIRANNVLGTITDNPLTIGATTFNSTLLPELPPVIGNHAIVTLDPLRQYGVPEIVIVTAHTAASTTATITRGAYGTIARSHPMGTVWIHNPMNEDYISILTSGTRPTDPFRGEGIFETDTNRYVGRSTADTWQQMGLFFDPPACRVYHNANQSIANSSDIPLAFNSERYDTNVMHDIVVNNTRITIQTAGLYVLTGGVEWSVTPGAGTFYLRYRINGATIIMLQGLTGATVFHTIATTWKFVVGDYVEILATQFTGAPINVVSSSAYSPELAATWIGRGN